ncbi:MAG: peptidyl-tRNA hydrolase [Chloroflexi bacterium]|nr:peptidyl-tRNA hydrolase [Chloroflexota bacterium]
MTERRLNMPVGCVDGDKLAVVTVRSDLGWGKGKHGNWWALRAFSAMCDQHDDLPYPYGLWTFPSSIHLAVERR